MHPFYRDTDHSAVTVQEAVGEWSLVAWDVLEEVAARWRRTITPERLAVEVQKRSGIVSSLPSETWIGPVVSLVAQRAHESKGPVLTSLVADADGGVPDSYREVVALQGDSVETLRELQLHALAARMVCHRVYGARIPAGADLAAELAPAPRATSPVSASSAATRAGSAPAPTSASAEKKTAPSARRRGAPLAVAEPPKPAVCPRCWIQLPATGHCDYCD